MFTEPNADLCCSNSPSTPVTRQSKRFPGWNTASETDVWASTNTRLLLLTCTPSVPLFTSLVNWQPGGASTKLWLASAPPFKDFFCWSRVSCSLITSLLLSPRRCSSLSIFWWRWDKSCRRTTLCRVMGCLIFRPHCLHFQVNSGKPEDIWPLPRVQEALSARGGAPACASHPASGTVMWVLQRRLPRQPRSSASSSSSLRKSETKTPWTLALR